MADLFESQQQNQCWFITRDAKDKIRCIDIYFNKVDENTYKIHRYSYQFQGKKVEQPVIIVDKGFVNRDPYAQTLLRFNALCKEYLDKGYKEIEKNPNNYTEEELNEFLPEFKTDANGFAKHMLAKPLDKCRAGILDTIPYWYASRKIDGCRVSFYWDEDKIRTASRGGGHYDYALQHFIQNEQFIEFFKRHPAVILDGEAYKHGWPLQKINGACRLEKNAVDCDQLSFYMYDIMVPNVSFETRNKIMLKIKEELNLGFDPYREWKDGELQMLIVPQEKVSGYDAVMALHNNYVEEGWEGLVLRNPKSYYGFGRRTNDMIKVKKYKDAEFQVVSYELGLRGTEDMVFVCQTPTGNLFKAKPLGDREVKEEYVKNFDINYKGKFATVKFFYYSNGGDVETGVPLQPALIAFRDINEFYEGRVHGNSKKNYAW